MQQRITVAAAPGRPVAQPAGAGPACPLAACARLGAPQQLAVRLLVVRHQAACVLSRYEEAYDKLLRLSQRLARVWLAAGRAGLCR
jgi:hypothetical protein